VRSGCIYVLATVPPYTVVRSTQYMRYNLLKIFRFTVYASIPCKGRYTALQEYTGIYTAIPYTSILSHTVIGSPYIFVTASAEATFGCSVLELS
jgi:hypothetical protein